MSSVPSRRCSAAMQSRNARTGMLSHTPRKSVRAMPSRSVFKTDGFGFTSIRNRRTMTEEPNFEDSLAALEATVDALSRGDLPLDRALAVFEEGLGLYRRCHAILADSEQRVTKLIAAAEGLIEEPFPVE